MTRINVRRSVVLVYRPSPYHIAAGRSIKVILAGQNVDTVQSQAAEGNAVAAVCCCRCAWLTLNRQWHDEAEMSDIGLTVSDMTEPPRRYDVTITVDQDGGHHPNPAEFAVAAQQAASVRAASIVSAHTSGQIVSIVTVLPPISPQPSPSVACSPVSRRTLSAGQCRVPPRSSC